MSAMDVDDAPAASAMTIEARIAELEESEIALLDGEPRPLGDACAHLLLAYLAGDRLEDARHLWRRTGEAPPGARFDGFEQLAHLTAIVTQLSA